MAGKKLEIAQMERFDIFEAVAKSEAQGKYTITKRWENQPKTNPQGEQVMRCRFVAREFKAASPWRADLFAPTTTSATSRLVDLRAVKRGQPTFGADGVNAFFQAPEEGEVYTHPPAEWVADHPEWVEAGVMWRMKKQLYGRRQAPER